MRRHPPRVNKSSFPSHSRLGAHSGKYLAAETSNGKLRDNGYGIGNNRNPRLFYHFPLYSLTRGPYMFSLSSLSSFTSSGRRCTPTLDALHNEQSTSQDILKDELSPRERAIMVIVLRKFPVEDSKVCNRTKISQKLIPQR